MTLVNESHGASHDHLETLKWVQNRGCIIQIITIDALDHRNALYDTFGLHAFNRKTDLCQVEFAREDLLTDHLDYLGTAASQTGENLLVSECETAMFLIGRIRFEIVGKIWVMAELCCPINVLLKFI